MSPLQMPLFFEARTSELSRSEWWWCDSAEMWLAPFGNPLMFTVLLFSASLLFFLLALPISSETPILFTHHSTLFWLPIDFLLFSIYPSLDSKLENHLFGFICIFIYIHTFTYTHLYMHICIPVYMYTYMIS